MANFFMSVLLVVLVSRVQDEVTILHGVFELGAAASLPNFGPRHPSLKKMVESLRFEAAIGFLIVINAIISGIDAMYKSGDIRRHPLEH